MRSNTMKTCAVGAMLFGGTLGMSQAASAGMVTWLDSVSSNNNVYVVDSSFELVGEAFNDGSAALSASQLTAGMFSASISASTATGFSMGLNVDTAVSGEQLFFQSSRAFSVAGTVNFSFMAGLRDGYLVADMFQLDEFGNETLLFGGVTTDDGGLLETGSLSAGTYRISVRLDAWDNTSSGTFASFAVPAPGAIALLGVAGLAGGRRRRN